MLTHLLLDTCYTPPPPPPQPYLVLSKNLIKGPNDGPEHMFVEVPPLRYVSPPSGSHSRDVVPLLCVPQQ